jgi:hypothetical protein
VPRLGDYWAVTIKLLEAVIEQIDRLCSDFCSDQLLADLAIDLLVMALTFGRLNPRVIVEPSEVRCVS